MARFDRSLVAGVLFSLASGADAVAAATPLAFDLPAMPPDRAALAIGLKAGISVGVTTRCRGPQVQLSGRFDVRTALDRVLARSDCHAVWLDETTVRLERRPRPPTPAPVAAAPPPEPRRPPSAAEAEVVVTASKRELDAATLPGSVTVLPGSTLQTVHARSTSDLRLVASGITVTNLGPGRDKVLLRGLSDGAFTGRTQSTVGLYWNGAPTTYNAPDPDLRLVDVSSIEVLRGPQGTLYGAGALGGVIDVVPNAPERGRWSASAAVEGAATASGDPSFAVESMFNAPLLGQRAALRVVAYDAEQGGWIDVPSLAESNTNHVHQTGLRAALLMNLTPEWNVTFGNTYQDIYSQDTQYTTGGVNSLSRTAALHEPHDNDFEQAYVDLRGKGGWGELRSLSAFTHHDFTSRYDASAALPAFGGGAGTAPFDDETLIRLVSEELDYRPPWHGPFGLLIGGYASYGDETEATSLVSIGGPEVYTEQRRDTLTDLSLFGEASYAITPRLSLTAGLRLSYAERRTLSRVGGPGGRSLYAGSTIDREASPKVALDYTVATGVHAYGLVSRGYRVGGFNTAGVVGKTVFTPSGGAQPNRAFSPDELWNYEVGLKLQGLRGRLEARTALYYDTWRRLQADQFLPSGLPYVANVGSVDIPGWEWEVTARLYRTLTLQMGALFTEPDIRKADPSFGPPKADFTLPGASRRTFNGDLSYTWALGGDRTLQIDGAALYQGHSYLFFSPQGQNQSETGKYLDLRLQGVVATQNWRLGLMVLNPLNDRGNTFAFGNPFSLSGPAQRTPFRPRTISVRLERAF